MRTSSAQVREAAGRPVLVTGAGDAFSAGLDLKEVAALDDAGTERFLGVLDDMMDALFDHPGPMVACVNGHAIAGGCVIALCADHPRRRRRPEDPHRPQRGRARPRVPAEDHRARAPSAVARTGRARAARGRALRAAPTALALGLVDEVAADRGLARAALLETLAAHPAPIYAATKRTLRGGALALTEADRRYFRDTVLPRWTAPAVKEKILAALKR